MLACLLSVYAASSPTLPNPQPLGGCQPCSRRQTRSSDPMSEFNIGRASSHLQTVAFCPPARCVIRTGLEVQGA